MYILRYELWEYYRWYGYITHNTEPWLTAVSLIISCLRFKLQPVTTSQPDDRIPIFTKLLGAWLGSRSMQTIKRRSCTERKQLYLCMGCSGCRPQARPHLVVQQIICSEDSRQNTVLSGLPTNRYLEPCL